jgi:hypothetical protein
LSDNVCRFPGTISGSISFPIDQVLEFGTIVAGVEDGVDEVMWSQGRIVVDKDWMKRTLDAMRDGVRGMRREEGDVKDGMDLHSRRKMKFNSNRT